MINRHSKLFLVIVFFGLIILSCQQKEAKTQEQTATSKVLTISDLREQIQKDTANALLFVQRADLYEKVGELDLATKDIRYALKIDSTNTDYWTKLSEYNLLQGKSGKARIALEKCLKIDKKNIDAILKLSEIYLYVKDYNKSMKHLVDAQNIDLNNSHIYFLKSLIYRETGDTTKAIENLNLAAQKDPESYDAYFNLGRIYFTLNDSLCIDYFKTALKISPKSIEAYYNIAMFWQKNNKPNKAIEEYQLLLKNADSTYYIAYFNIGYIYLNMLKDYQKAIKNFTTTIEMKNNYYQAFYNRGYSFELLTDYANAENDYRAALDILPNYPLAVEGLNRLDKKNKITN